MPLAHLRMTIVAPLAGPGVVIQHVRSRTLRGPTTKALPSVLVRCKSLIYGWRNGQPSHTQGQELVLPDNTPVLGAREKPNTQKSLLTA